VWGLTDTDRAGRARDAARDALDDAGVAGDVRVVRPRNRGAAVALDPGDTPAEE
jgi:beta-ribofuranosylaminobenzene 5'-phosphate synthase